jgi:IrrE N-terminal-like domain
MHRGFNREFVSDKVSSLLSRFAEGHGPLRPPIEPADMASLCGVLKVEYRRMIPEGVLTPVPGGFRIYLQNNFTQLPGNRVRERFTLAHELAHTFFFDTGADMPRPMRGTPKGSRLERLCHIGASQIVVPAPLLRAELEPEAGAFSVGSLLNLARRFEVSVEVLLRRTHELGLVADAGFAAVLVDVLDASRQVIRAACYDTLLLCNATKPVRGADFNSWVRPLLAPSGSPADTEWVCTTKTARITAKKVFRSTRSFILGLRLDRPTSASPMVLHDNLG